MHREAWGEEDEAEEDEEEERTSRESFAGLNSSSGAGCPAARRSYLAAGPRQERRSFSGSLNMCTRVPRPITH